MADEASFALDPRLAQDSIVLGDLPLSRVLLTNDANYPWLILVPRRPNLVELIDLDDSGQATLMIEIALVSRFRSSPELAARSRCELRNRRTLANL
jgi:diadenosine tetraphosphate (Ap4A) HIT family hydrolase